MNQLILYPTESGTYWRKPADPNVGGWELCEVDFVDDVVVKVLGYPAFISQDNWPVYANQWYWYGPTLVLPPFEVKGFSKSDLEAVRNPSQKEEPTHGFADGVGTIQTDATVPVGFTASFDGRIE